MQKLVTFLALAGVAMWGTNKAAKAGAQLGVPEIAVPVAGAAVLLVLKKLR